MSLQACANLVAKGDPDRFAATMAAPVAARRVLFPFYAFNLEVARAPWVTQEPLIAEMRLQWWADALDEIARGGPVRRHEVTDALGRSLGAGGCDHPAADSRCAAARRTTRALGRLAGAGALSGRDLRRASLGGHAGTVVGRHEGTGDCNWHGAGPGELPACRAGVSGARAEPFARHVGGGICAASGPRLGRAGAATGQPGRADCRACGLAGGAACCSGPGGIRRLWPKGGSKRHR